MNLLQSFIEAMLGIALMVLMVGGLLLIVAAFVGGGGIGVAVGLIGFVVFVAGLTLTFHTLS